MADISALGNLQPVEPLDLDNYADTKEYFELPKKGVYTAQAPSSFPSEAFQRAKTSGALTVSVDPTIVGPTNAGYKVRFTRPSAKQYKRSGATVSQVGDYLRAFGIKGRVSNEQELADLVETTANRTFQVELDWKAFNTSTGLSIEGMENFPSDGNGGHLPYVIDPNDFVRNETTGEIETDAQGNKMNKRVPARVYVSRFIAA